MSARNICGILMLGFEEPENKNPSSANKKIILRADAGQVVS